MKAEEIKILRKFFMGYVVIGANEEEIKRKCGKISNGDTNGFIQVDNPHVQQLVISQSKEIEQLKEEIKYQDKHIDDLNQLSTDRGNENTQLKQRITEAYDKFVLLSKYEQSGNRPEMWSNVDKLLNQPPKG